jgi:hypothetical protein
LLPASLRALLPELVSRRRHVEAQLQQISSACATLIDLKGYAPPAPVRIVQPELAAVGEE